MTKSKFKIADLVRIDYSVDWVAGYVVRVHQYNNAGTYEYYYDVVDFYDGGTDKHISEKWITLLEDEHVPLLIHAKCETS